MRSEDTPIAPHDPVLMETEAGQAGDPPVEALAGRDVFLLESLATTRRRVEAEIAKQVVGQLDVIEGMLIAILAGGHSLLVGVPGLAKTLLVNSLAKSLHLKFSRIQFTPDLMPSDITGTEIIEENVSTGRRDFRFVGGPIFANVVLADEINRTPPKTQAALLQAMQEGEVTVGGETHRLERPFFVLATQNPIEQSGTYPLPEAQLDRFMLELRITYPSATEEEEVASRTTADHLEEVEPILSGEELLELQGLVRRVPAPPSLIRLAVHLCRASRPDDPAAPDFVKRWVNWGVGPRGTQHLVLAAKARAALDGRAMPNYEDIQAVAQPVLRHRVVTNFQAEADGQTAENIVASLLDLTEDWI
ncbi:MAG: MoxR family ATPase [Candidatus Palauibacterales bacterium]|nr:MoxR family ATPase [Candidatus Palauibacterales bacterium]